MPPALRDYQARLVEEVRAAWAAGRRRPCIVAPCGSGKTVVAAEILRRTTAAGRRALFLAHRRELCEQAERVFQSWGVDPGLCDVAMVQTACRRLARLPPPALIVTDESHHGLAQSYRKVYDAFPRAYGLGVTATPERLGGAGLGAVYDALVLGPTVRQLLDRGDLAPFDYYAPSLGDLTGLHTRRGEYVASEAEARLNRPRIHDDVLACYRRYADGRQAVCYCVNVAHSQAVAAAFRAAGVPAVHLDGETPQGERLRTVAAFREGETRVLCNVNLVGEGFDVPDCGASILLRPTKSLALYLQQAMRCLRPRPGKRAVILDHVGHYARFGLPDADRVWTLADKPRRPGGQAPAALRVRQCPQCYYTFQPQGQAVCPACGAALPHPRRMVREDADSRLTRIQGFVVRYDSPADCRNVSELSAYARARGYKPGWAWRQARARGWL